jgi:hypothetical protein
MGMEMKKYLIIAALVIAVAFSAFAIYNSLVFRLVSTQPANKAPQVSVGSPVVFTFNHALRPDSGRDFTIEPATVGRVEVKDRQVKFTPTFGYKANTTYTATLPGAVNERGQASGPHTVTFTAAYVDFDQMSPAEQQHAIEESNSLEKDFPIVESLPAESSTYEITHANVENGKLKISIKLYATLNRPSQFDQYQADLKAAKKAALDYITSHKGDLSKLSITYDPAEAEKL